MATNFPDTSINNPNTGVGWANGDAFDDTANSGLIYYWYDPVWKTSLSSADADAKYVEVDGDTMTGDLTVPSLNSGQLAGFRNQIINGDFRVWQRGDSFAAGSDVVRYSADRWENNGTTSGVSKAAGFAGFPSAAAVTAASGFSYLVQHIEIDPLADFTQFAPGSTWTLSYWMRDNTSGNPSVDYRGDSAGTNQVVWTPAEAVETIETSGTWTRYARTFTAPTYVQGNHDRVTVYVPASSSSLVLITGVQLEPGPVATPFEHRPIGTELALCQRYYAQGHMVEFAPVGSYSSTYTLWVDFPVPMRAFPTISALGVALHNSNVGTSIDSTIGNFQAREGNLGSRVFITPGTWSGTPPTGSGAALSADLNLKLDAEL